MDHSKSPVDLASALDPKVSGKADVQALSTLVARQVLRLIPLIRLQSLVDLPGSELMVLSSIRAMNAGWAVSVGLTSNGERENIRLAGLAAQKMANLATDPLGQAVQNAAASVAFAVSREESSDQARRELLDSVRSSKIAIAESDFGSRAVEDFRIQERIDLQAYDDGVVGMDFVPMPLWQATPDWFDDCWWALREHLLSRKRERWAVWTDWYEARVRGDPVNIEAEVARVLFVREDAWRAGPKVANAQIASVVNQIRGQPQTSEPSKDEILKSIRRIINEDDEEEGETANEQDDHESHNDISHGLAEDASSAELASRPPESPKITDEARGNRDAPTTEDRLGRRPFAHKLVDLVEGLKADTDAFDFAIHMHAPWGVGKSSVIAMMTEILQDGDRQNAENWAVFTFNAWEHEHRKLPWWPFLRLLRQASIDEKNRRGAWHEVIWTRLWWWTRRIGDVLAPILFAVVAVSLLCWLLISQGLFVTDAGIDWPKIAGLIAAGTTLFVTFTALGRRLLFGAKEQSDFYFSLSRNPWKRVRTRFRHLAGGLARPVCIFIDDLDRCQAEYVVDVLTGIQTHFRKDNVVFVVAADRKWLRTSFETAFCDFVGKSGQQEDRLGYLFLEKVFQLSVPLPRIPSYYREAYIRELLGDEDAEEPPDALSDSRGFDEALKVRQTEGRATATPPVETALSETDTQVRPTVREAAKKTADALEKSVSQTETRAAKHRLRDLIDCFPANPRVIKRVINAYGVYMFEAFFEDLNVSEERRNLIARWAILEQCYPALIDILVDQPDLANCFHPVDAERTPVPDGPEFRQFSDLSAVTALFVADDVLHLTPDVVREFTEGQRG